jgi:3-oxoacyl-[acyl-carrier-protein] synthase III
MMGELSKLDLEIDMIVPHQANKNMIIDIAVPQGIDAKDIYFNIAEVGNASAASIPIAMADAVFDGAITKRSLIFTPGFGAGAVGGYVVMWLDPAIVVPEVAIDLTKGPSPSTAHSSLEDIKEAFGG